MLISLLLWGLKAANESARRAACLSNLRDQTRALFLYMDSYNKGLLPASPSIRSAWSEDESRALNGEIYKLIYDEDNFPNKDGEAYVKKSPYACPSDPVEYFNRFGFSYDYHVGIWMEKPPSYRVDSSMASKVTHQYIEYSSSLRVFEDASDFHVYHPSSKRGINASFFDGSVNWTNQPSFKK